MYGTVNHVSPPLLFHVHILLLHHFNSVDQYILNTVFVHAATALMGSPFVALTMTDILFAGFLLRITTGYL